MTYGALSLSAQTLTIMSIVAVLMLIAACFLHAARYRNMALLIQFISFIPLLILVVTWFTVLNKDEWADLGFIPPVAGLIIGAVALFGPPRVGDWISDI